MTDRFLCSICKQNTIHHIIHSFQRTEEIHDPGDSAYPARTDLVYCTYEITCCAGCETVCFREKWFDHFHQINEDGTPDESSRLYSTRGEILPQANTANHCSQIGLQSTARDLITHNLNSDADLDAFFIDNYNDIHREFSAGMNRTQKINMALEKLRNKLPQLVQSLQEHVTAKSSCAASTNPN